MGKYLGEKELADAYGNTDVKDQINRKGLLAEIEVGAFLKKYLPEDTIIIAHPQIGDYDPDFLVISPRYGFRIIEVKNWDFSKIINAESNGAISFSLKTFNPMEQAKKHRDELRQYIKSCHNISNPTIDCLVLHYGFTKDAFNSNYDNNWNPIFYRSTLFKDQLDEHLDERLRISTKFSNLGIGKEKIEKIIRSIKISEKIYSSGAAEEIINDKEEEIKKNKEEIKIKTDEINSKTAKIGFHEKEEHSMKKLIYVVIALLTVIIVSIYGVFIGFESPVADENKFKKATSISEMVASDANLGKQFESALSVQNFTFDSNSGTKFLILSDGELTIKGVIFKDTPGIPYIEENATYTITGTLDIYNSEYQLKISEVKPQN